MSDIVIQAENLGKKYTIGHQAENGRAVALRDGLVNKARKICATPSGALPVICSVERRQDLVPLQDSSTRSVGHLLSNRNNHMISRQPNLDLIRALAILLVLVHHIGQSLTNLPRTVHQYTSLGAYGVNLFFVLSGWLLGSLYWRERQQFKNVQLLRFWGRRLLRTIPPYFVVLPIAYLSVYIARGEEFNIGYLFFLQNYEDTVPFFLVSWFLCVEVHFYVLMPVLLILLTATKSPLRVAIPAILIVSFMARFLDPFANPNQGFGYSETASHLNLSGLLLGVWFSYLAINEKSSWIKTQQISKIILFPLFLGFLLIPFTSSSIRYYLVDGYVTIFFGALLATLTALPTLNIAKLKPTYILSITSYSIYLTHSIVLNACISLTEKYKLYREAVFPIWIVAMLITGYIFFSAVERPSIVLRDRLIPRRERSAQP